MLVNGGGCTAAMGEDGEVYRVSSPSPVRRAARKRGSVSSRPDAMARRPNASSNGSSTLDLLTS